MSFSNYLEGEIVKHAMRTGSWTKPTNLYAALFTDDPAEDASGTEVSGGAYARVAILVADAQWSAISAGRTGNVNSILFPSPSGANWGTVTHTALFDSLTTGNMYFYGVLAVSKVIDDGDPAPFFPADQFGITLD
tara:strand:- start:1013 stop:1417 length:405 start_codon:yes stop_codon:yes gene_type:complete